MNREAGHHEPNADQPSVGTGGLERLAEIIGVSPSNLEIRAEVRVPVGTAVEALIASATVSSPAQPAPFAAARSLNARTTRLGWQGRDGARAGVSAVFEQQLRRWRGARLEKVSGYVD
jgi:hypothetical protein